MFDEVKGFAVTMRRLVKPHQTIQYPDEKRDMAPRFRGLPSLGSGPGEIPVDLISGTVLTVRNATQILLTPVTQ